MKKYFFWSKLSLVVFIVCALAVSVTAEQITDLTYNVTFDLAGKGIRTGGGGLNQTIEPGDEATEPTFTVVTGWTFTGWDKAFDNITENTTVTATYSAVVTYNGMVGVLFTLPLIIVSDTPLKTVTVTGLPSGLRYDSKTKTVTGVPTAPAVNKPVKVTAKNASKVPIELTFTVTVVPLPVWAWGSFSGSFSGELGYGTVQANVTSKGRITGKVSTSGNNYRFSANSYARRDEDGAFWVSVVSGAGKTARTLTFKVNNPENFEPPIEPPTLSIMDVWYGSDVSGDPVANLYRNVWKDEGMADVLKNNYTGYYTAVLPGVSEYGSSYLALTVDEAGGVKTTGKLADGTALSLSGTLIFDFRNEPACAFTVIYASPAAYKGGCVYGRVEFVKPKEEGNMFLRLLDGISFHWENKNNLSSASGTGFNRELGLVGGWYDKLIDLQAYYTDGLTTVGDIPVLPVLNATVRITDFGENERKVTTSEKIPFNAVCGNPGGLLLKVTAQALCAPKAQVPIKAIDPDTKQFLGYYEYPVDNPTGLILNFTRATGLFKGAFNIYYDYISADDLTTDPERQTYAHIVKRASYEGVLTPVREDLSDGIGGRGFFCWPANSEYVNAQNRVVPYSYKESYDFIIQGTK